MDENDVPVKCQYNGEWRRFRLSPDASFQRLVDKSGKVFNVTWPSNPLFFYKDDDDDKISMSSSLELKEAFSLREVGNGFSLKFYIQDDQNDRVLPSVAQDPTSSVVVDVVGGIDGPSFSPSFSSSSSEDDLVEDDSQDLVDEVLAQSSVDETALALSDSAQVRLKKAGAEKDEKTESSCPILHRGVTCDRCQMSPIRGIRFKCLQCPDFDLCAECDTRADIIEDHHPNHVMLKLPITISFTASVELQREMNVVHSPRATPAVASSGESTQTSAKTFVRATQTNSTSAVNVTTQTPTTESRNASIQTPPPMVTSVDAIHVDTENGIPHCEAMAGNNESFLVATATAPAAFEEPATSSSVVSLIASSENCSELSSVVDVVDSNAIGAVATTTVRSPVSSNTVPPDTVSSSTSSRQEDWAIVSDAYEGSANSSGREVTSSKTEPKDSDTMWKSCHSTTPSDMSTLDAWDDLLGKLAGMGFSDRETNTRLLVECDGDLETVIERLL